MSSGTKIVYSCLIGSVLFLLLFILVVINLGDSNSENSSYAITKWYQGGTLHQEGASYNNKLATCANFISSQWVNKNLDYKIQNSIMFVDDIRPYAEGLVNCLDEAILKQPDSELNNKMYANQTVAEMAIECMILMRLTK